MDGVLATIYSDQLSQSRSFYVDVLGLEVADEAADGQITVVSAKDPALRLLLRHRDQQDVPLPFARSWRGVRLTVEVPDIDKVHAFALEHGHDIVYPLTGDGGGRRFVTLDPDGMFVEVVTAAPGAAAGSAAGSAAEAGAAEEDVAESGSADEPDLGFQLPPHARRLSELVDAITPWAVRVVATLGVPDLIAQGEDDIASLAARSGADVDALARVLRHLVHKGVFSQPEPGRYALTPVAELLLDTDPMHMRDWLDMSGAPARWDQTYSGMLRAVRTGAPVYDAVFGRPFWDDLSADATLSASFDALMAQLAGWSVPDVVAGYDWSQVHHVVDVGGGSGTLLTAILRADERLRGTLVDRSKTATAAGERFAAAGVADRCQVVTGDFFTDLPPGGDVYILANVLHDWSDEQAGRILRNCARAAGPHGRILIVEMLMGGAGDQSWMAEMDLMMLCAVGGRKRTVEQFRLLTATVGLHLRSVHETPAHVSLLECVSAGPTS